MFCTDSKATLSLVPHGKPNVCTTVSVPPSLTNSLTRSLTRQSKLGPSLRTVHRCHGCSKHDHGAQRSSLSPLSKTFELVVSTHEARIAVSHGHTASQTTDTRALASYCFDTKSNKNINATVCCSYACTQSSVVLAPVV